jgi:translocator protein
LQSCAVARLLSHARLERAASPGALLPSGTTTLALSSYVVMTLLGNAWNAVFFGKRQLKKSVAVMGAFWASLLASIVTAERADHAAGVLIAPTLVWVTIAAALNYSIVQLNKDKWE